MIFKLGLLFNIALLAQKGNMGIKAIHEIIKDITGKGPESEHKLTYDSASETLEPIYFFILDTMESFKLNPQKLVDNFISSPGSGHFAELGQRATMMQQQGSRILGDINTVLRSVLNLIYDLKEFKIRLQHYDDLKSKDKNLSMAAKLSLKQIWMDKVDFQKGNSSIKALALGQAGFQTLLDAFLVSDTPKEASKLDLNDRVKRIVTSRVAEYNAWLEQSEKELRKRYALERNYLRSQVNALKLYTRWARPYLVAASRLESTDSGRNPALVNVFNTILLELTLLGKSEINVRESAMLGELPPEFAKEPFLKKNIKRKYFAVILVDFKFRGIPQRVAQQSHYAFGGKAEIIFRAYAMNDDELEKFEKELDNSDLSDAMNLIQGATDDSLKQMQEEINFFLDEKDETKESKKGEDTSNPFLALFGFYEKNEKPKEKKSLENKDIIVKKDSWVEREYIRKFAAENAKTTSLKVFEIYKKANGMPTPDEKF